MSKYTGVHNWYQLVDDAAWLLHHLELSCSRVGLEMKGAGPTLAGSRRDEPAMRRRWLTDFTFASWLFFLCEDAMKGGWG